MELAKWSLMADMQLRGVAYETKGTDNDLSNIDVDTDFLFFNPKLGARYKLNAQSGVYAYAGMGSREPVRNDFIDAPVGEVPEAELLINGEMGYNFAGKELNFNANGYLMYYDNQLVPTGELNDVGAIIRENVGTSYRLGIEIDATYAFSSTLSWNVNATFSRNKIGSFIESIEDFAPGGAPIVNEYSNTDIAYSPSVIAASRILWVPIKNFELNLISKYVGQQYLDNTQSENKSLDAYFVNDFRISYAIDNLLFDRIEVNLLINNIFNVQYSSNGYTYSYAFEEVVTENFYFPQAGTNFLMGLNLHF
jgi:iron complex outermembrane receptor protein